MQFLPAEKTVWAIGLMSGTSLDGVDAALLRTDGERIDACGPALTVPYLPAFQDQLRALIAGQADADALARTLTEYHVEAVDRLWIEGGVPREEVAWIGFHGQTVLHAPHRGITWQIGDPAFLAAQTGISVVCDFRRNDVAHGGQGAPLVPVFHRALAGALERPVVIVNIGGVANLTYVAPDGALLAFDTGPGNALLNDWVYQHLGHSCDADGALARVGTASMDRVRTYLEHPFFQVKPPKSLDRNAFDAAALRGLDVADGAATLTRFTAAAIHAGLAWLPCAPERVLVSGGGRHNPAMMAALEDVLPCPVAAVETWGWNGDALEAQAFAYLAVRSAHGLPLTFPGTTGVAAPTGGGVLYYPRPHRSLPARS